MTDDMMTDGTLAEFYGQWQVLTSSASLIFFWFAFLCQLMFLLISCQQQSKVNAKLIAKKHGLKYRTFHHQVSTSKTSRQVKGLGHVSGVAQKTRKLWKGIYMQNHLI